MFSDEISVGFLRTHYFVFVDLKDALPIFETLGGRNEAIAGVSIEFVLEQFAIMESNDPAGLGLEQHFGVVSRPANIASGVLAFLIAGQQVGLAFAESGVRAAGDHLGVACLDHADVSEFVVASQVDHGQIRVFLTGHCHDLGIGHLLL